MTVDAELTGSPASGGGTRTTNTAKSLVRELAEVVVLAFILYFVITFAVQTVHVIGESMVPTLSNDDYLIATKIDYKLHQPRRGDIIIMRDPYDHTKDFIKRVVALPGEKLLIRNGQVYINGQRLEEPYLANNEPWTEQADWPCATCDGEVMQANHFFVMGDNRNRSSDSRVFGPVAGDQIEARAVFRILPLSQIGFIDNQHPVLETS